MENQILKTKKPKFKVEGMAQGKFFAKQFTILHKLDKKKGNKITWDLFEEHN